MDEAAWKAVRFCRSTAHTTWLNYSSFDHDERVRKRTARERTQVSKDAQNLRGLRAKLFQKQRYRDKVQLRKTIKEREEKNVSSAGDAAPADARPAYLLDRSAEKNAKSISTSIKQKRADKAARFNVPLPKVKGLSEEEVFSVVTSGKRKNKSWKRMVWILRQRSAKFPG